MLNEPLNPSIINYVWLRAVTNHAEAKAYVDYSVTGTIGSQTVLGGAVTGYQDWSILGNDHGAEWNKSIQQLRNTTASGGQFGFYGSLLKSFELEPLP